MTRILVVDDDESIRALLQAIFSDEGFHVSVARTGKEALDLLRQGAGWVVLLDVRLPGMDGYEVVRQLKENPAWLDDHRVVLMSASSVNIPGPFAAISDVVLAVVPKPFEMDTLLKTVQQAASGKETSEG